ncbi:ATPase P [Dyella thiooxydans]|uniref:ATPase P n=1 Tax=Dyella thiooxydans TaxID=445710 RepID=A0A160N341_9GAMM|nr:cation-translocating P-type ATPase [Dyella thiooxydans]AND70260.1 ATPase P [Dyella thiooxydans]
MNAVWAHPQLAAQVLRPRRDGRAEASLRVSPLDDPRRVLHVEQVLRALPGVQRVGVDAPRQRVSVVWDPACQQLPALLDALGGIGCRAEPLPRSRADGDAQRAAHDLLKRLLVAGMCAMQVMTYAFVIYIGVVDFVDFSTRGLFRWLGFLTTLPIVGYAALPFYRGALAELRARRPGIDLPVALAVLLVFAGSAWNTWRGGGEIYFDSVSMFVFLLLVARYVELRARQRSGALGDATVDAAPLLAERLGAGGRREWVAATTLLPGDRVHVAEGATVPADGVLESAHAELDEALLSGESRPVRRVRGEPLVAGSVLLSGPVELTVRHSGEATAAARIGALARRAQGGRLTAEATADPQATRFVQRVLVLTLLTALGWLLVDPSRAFEASVAVLVIACPCAFALTVPATRARAFGVLAARGVLVADGAALERLARVDFALFDKTGTLTHPGFVPDDIVVCRGTRDDSLRLAGALAQGSSHPLSRALARLAAEVAAAPLPVVENLRALPGVGLSGRVDGCSLRLGRADGVLAGAVPPALEGCLVLADAAGPLAGFRPREQLRQDAVDTLAALQAQGVQVALASGDAPPRVATIAAALGIGQYAAQQTPADKLALLRQARDRGHVTLAVGDGSNDAPVLAGADVSAALAGGTALAQAHAGLLLAGDRLDGLLAARAVAGDMQRIVAQSRRWALGYNLIAVPFAAFGLVPPWLAGIGMALSSLGVVLNALRTGRRLPAPGGRA